MTRVLPEPSNVDLGTGVAALPQFQDEAGVARPKDFAGTIEDRFESRSAGLETMYLP